MKSEVLVACPTWAGDKPYMEEFIRIYEDYDMMFVDNTIFDNLEYYDYLSSFGIKVYHYEWNPGKMFILEMLSKCNNIIRDYFLSKGYRYWLWTNPDIRPPSDAVNRLIEHDRDVVGFAANIWSREGPPSALRSGKLVYDTILQRFKLDLYDWEDILDAEENPMRVWGVGGVVLYKRKVLHDCEFIYPKEYLWGEDCWYWAICNEKGYQFWVDTSDRAYNLMSKEWAVKLINQYKLEYRRNIELDERTQLIFG